jgi:hypothetical protein
LGKDREIDLLVRLVVLNRKNKKMIRRNSEMDVTNGHIELDDFFAITRFPNIQSAICVQGPFWRKGAFKISSVNLGKYDKQRKF